MVVRSVLLFALLALSAGCTATPSRPPETVDEARAAWEARGGDRYTFVIRRDCYCLEEYAGPFAVTVRDGQTTVTRNGAPAEANLVDGLPTNAEALFAFVAARQAHEGFRVRFDPISGFVLSVWSDPIPAAADDELGLTISDVVINE